ncbi:hypothetical protein H6K86_11990 [Staphylococcus epidermidis]|nr:hypothetical protein [Staphylococcus epidermidis]MBM6212253.1 hypothetical protein [Staphylococcus epidermidis]MBM6226162.1 hypothetical protein [Staphylococcus epidermidis]MBM6230747.1 hypothetical protein [Staphylococcus epidermidis]MCG8930756.1 hypothetical protein [Staphylococcus epidermidis]
MKKEKIGYFVLGICLLLIGYISIMKLIDICPSIWTILSDKFSDTKFMMPFLAYVLSSVVVYCITGVVTIIFIDTISEVGSRVIKCMLTAVTVYVIFIGPLIMLSMMIVMNIPIQQIAIVFTILSFIGISLKKFKSLTIKIYSKLDNYI